MPDAVGGSATSVYEKSMAGAVAVDGASVSRSTTSTAHSPDSVHHGVREKEGVKEDDEDLLRNFVPPDGGYGWVVVASQTLINGMTWGVNASFAIYLSHYTANATQYFPGTTTTQFTFVGGISVCTALLVSPVSGLLSHLFGHRMPMFLGCFLEAAAFISASYAKKFWQLFLSQGVLFGVGLGLLYAPAVHIPAQWFGRRRALAQGITSGGSGLGGVIFNLGTNAMIQNISLEWSFRIIGIVVFVTNFVATCLMKSPPEIEKLERTKRHAKGARSLDKVVSSMVDPGVWQRHDGFTWIILWGFLSLLGYVTVQFSITKEAVNYLDFSQKQGSDLAALLSAGMAVGRPAVGYVGDRVGRINTAIGATLATSLLCLLLWMFARSYPAMVVFALLDGTVVGTFWSSIIPVTAEIVGLQDLRPAATIVWLVMSIPCCFATTIALRIVADSNNYLRLIGFAGAMYIAAAAALYPAKWRKQQRDGLKKPWKVWQKT
ncbi:hypothetical protein PYCC9005_005132 [Savitreella phatthalungensis]